MPGPTVLLTRPREDSEETAAALAKIGVESIIAPLIEIEVRRETPPLSGVQALVITSANGVRAFAQQSDNRSLPVFAVGDASAKAARALGFGSVESAGGTIEDLTELVRARLKPRDGRLLHPAGSVIAGDLAAKLSLHRYDVRRYVAYAARTARELPPLARAAIVDGLVEMILLYSPRTAEVLRDLVTRAELDGECRFLDALCLSDAVARALSPLKFRNIRVAERPDQAALFALIEGPEEISS